MASHEPSPPRATDVDESGLPKVHLGDEVASAWDVLRVGAREARQLFDRFRQRVASALEHQGAEVVHRLGRKVLAARAQMGLGPPPLQIEAYRGFASRDEIRIMGRVVAARSVRPPSVDDRPIDNLRRVVREFAAFGIPRATVTAKLGLVTTAAVADDEGFFALDAAAPTPLPTGRWLTVGLELADRLAEHHTIAARAEVLVPGPRARFAIVSDIDDTVLESHADGWLRMTWVTMSGNALTRRSFDGTSAFLTALAQGSTGADDNPFFYVSRSPWNLYGFLTAFLERQGLPKGPLLLRALGREQREGSQHKTETIDLLLARYPELPFVFFGDSGESDPDIYLDIAHRHPGRVRTIYIRDETGRLRGERGRAFHAEAERHDAELVVVTRTDEALEHARKTGLVAPTWPAAAAADLHA